MPLIRDAYLVLYEFISFFFPSFSCLSLSSLERLIKVCLLALPPLPRRFIYSPSPGAHIHLYVEGGILISGNFPPHCMGEKWGERQENTDVGSIEWQMKNGCEIDTRVQCIFFYTVFPIKCQVAYISGEHIVPGEESECKSIICFSFRGWNWRLRRWYALLPSRETTEGWKEARATLGLKWALIQSFGLSESVTSPRISIETTFGRFFYFFARHNFFSLWEVIPSSHLEKPENVYIHPHFLSQQYLFNLNRPWKQV